MNTFPLLGHPPVRSVRWWMFDVLVTVLAAAIVVPVDEYRKLRALERLAPPDELEAAEADAVLEAYREWVAAGRPGAVSHEEAMAELLGGSP